MWWIVYVQWCLAQHLMPHSQSISLMYYKPWEDWQTCCLRMLSRCWSLISMGLNSTQWLFDYILQWLERMKWSAVLSMLKVDRLSAVRALVLVLFIHLRLKCENMKCFWWSICMTFLCCTWKYIVIYFGAHGIYHSNYDTIPSLI